MPTRWETYPIKFEGGLITNINRLEHGAVMPGSATVLQNYEPDVREGYTRILGYTKYSATAVPGTGQIFGVVALSNTEALALRQGVFQYSSGTTWTSKLSQTVASSARIEHEDFNFNGVRHTAIVDGVNAPAYFNHATKNLAYVPTPPSDIVGATRVALFKSHMFFSKGSLVSFSAPFDAEDFTTGAGAGVINVGDTVVSLKVFRDQLIIFCRNRIFRLTGNTEADFQLQSITNDTGCLCGYTVQEVGGDIMYLGPDGIRYLSASERENDFGLTRASEKIQTLVTAANNLDCNFSSVTLAPKSQYRLFIFASNVPRAEASGFLATKFSNQSAEDISWATLKGMKVYSVSKYQSPQGETSLFSSDTNFVYRMESGSSFDGEDIESIFETPYAPVNDPKIRKTFYKHTLYIRPTGDVEIGMALKFDYGQVVGPPPPPISLATSAGAVWGAPSTIWGSFTWTSPSDKELFNNIVGSGFTISLRYYDKSQRPSYNLNFAILEYRTHERR